VAAGIDGDDFTGELVDYRLALTMVLTAAGIDGDVTVRVDYRLALAMLALTIVSRRPSLKM